MGYRDGVVPTRGWVDSCRWSFDEATFSFRKQWRGIGIVSNRWRWGFVCVRKRFGLSLGDSNERFRIEPNSRKRESRWWFDFYARNVAEEKIFFLFELNGESMRLQMGISSTKFMLSLCRFRWGSGGFHRSERIDWCENDSKVWRFLSLFFLLLARADGLH